MERPPSSAVHERLLVGLIAAALVGGLLWSGSARSPATLVLAALGALALVVAASDGPRLLLPPAALPLLVLGAACLLQLVPLPPAVKAALSPVAARTELRALAGLEDPSRWRPLTADAGATAHAAALLVGLAAFSVALSRFASDRRRAQLRAIVLAALAAFLAISLLGALGAPLPHALLPASPTRAPLHFPLVNPNHAASLLALLLPTVIAMTARSEGLARPAMVALVVAGNAALLGTMSRAGIAVGLVAEALVLVGLTGRGHSRRSSWNRGLDVIVTGALLLGLFVAAGPLVARFQAHAPEVRLVAWRDALAMLRDHLWFGAGRGAFLEVFARYNSAAALLRFGYVENEVLQVAIDVGIVGLVAVAAALFVAGRWAAVSLPSPSERTRAAVVGLGALALHNLVDFSLEMGGVAVAACAVAALAFPSAGRPISRLAAGALALVAAALVAMAAMPRFATAAHDEQALAAAVDSGASREETEALARELFARHPADTYLAEVTAARLLALDAPGVMDWLDRALLDGPRDAVAHRLTARALAARGLREQAATELHAALADADGTMALELCRDALALFPRVEDAAALAEALPARPSVVHMALGLLGERQRWREIELIGDAALDDDPDDAAVLRWMVTAGVAAGSKNDLAARATRLAQLDSSMEAALLAARALAFAGDGPGADRVLGDALARSGSPEIAVALSTLAFDRGDVPRAVAALDEALARAVSTAAKARLHFARADLEERRGNPSRAAVERAEAQRLASH